MNLKRERESQRERVRERESERVSEKERNRKRERKRLMIVRPSLSKASFQTFQKKFHNFLHSGFTAGLRSQT